jgi:nucleotide-binding universal stress UspA family protein
VHSGPVIIGFDGSRGAQHAVSEVAPLLAGQEVVVAVVWEAGAAFELVDNPSLIFDSPPASLDVRTAFEADEAAFEAAKRCAEQGARLAADAGMKAEALAVADATSPAETLVRLARDRDARAVVLGAHGHSRVSELVFGTTSESVLRHAPCPVIVVRQH